MYVQIQIIYNVRCIIYIYVHCLFLIRAKYIASLDWTIRSPFSTRTLRTAAVASCTLCTVIETGFVSDKFLAFISLVYPLPSPYISCFWSPIGVVLCGMCRRIWALSCLFFFSKEECVLLHRRLVEMIISG